MEKHWSSELVVFNEKPDKKDTKNSIKLYVKTTKILIVKLNLSFKCKIYGEMKNIFSYLLFV